MDRLRVRAFQKLLQGREETGEQAPLLHQAFNLNVLFQRLIAVSQRAEAVEGCNAEGPYEVAVRTATGALVCDIKPDRACDRARRVGQGS